MIGISIPGDSAAHRTEWVPSALPGCVLWLRADMGITLNGSTVSAWADQSGNGHNLIQATAAQQPLFVASGPNGKPTVRADGVDDFMATAGFTLNQPETLYLIEKNITYGTAGVHDILADGATAGTMVVGSVISGGYSISAGSAITYAASVANNAYDYVRHEYNGASSGIFVHGAASAAGNAGANNAGGLTLFALGNGTRSVNSEVAEVIIFNRVLLASEVAQVDTYIKARYAL